MALLWVLLVVGTVLAVEGFFRLPLGALVAQLQALLKKISHTISTPAISDHWKEKVLPRYAAQLFGFSIKLFIIIVLALSPFFVLGVVTGLFDVPFMAFLATPVGISASTVLAIVYSLIRLRQKRG